ncbi:hypothetical protein [Deinococcus caeni]
MTRYKTAKYATEVEEVAKLFFQDSNGNPDLNLSVYVIRKGDLNMMRLKAEHSAFCRLDPEAKGSIEISTIIQPSNLKASRDGGCFSYREDNHYELISKTRQEIDDICSDILSRGILHTAQSITDKEAVRVYAKSALAGKHGFPQKAQWELATSDCQCASKSACQLKKLADLGQHIPAQGCKKLKGWAK